MRPEVICLVYYFKDLKYFVNSLILKSNGKMMKFFNLLLNDSISYSKILKNYVTDIVYRLGIIIADNLIFIQFKN